MATASSLNTGTWDEALKHPGAEVVNGPYGESIRVKEGSKSYTYAKSAFQQKKSESAPAPAAPKPATAAAPSAPSAALQAAAPSPVASPDTPKDAAPEATADSPAAAMAAIPPIPMDAGAGLQGGAMGALRALGQRSYPQASMALAGLKRIY